MEFARSARYYIAKGSDMTMRMEIDLKGVTPKVRNPQVSLRSRYHTDFTGVWSEGVWIDRKSVV